MRNHRQPTYYNWDVLQKVICDFFFGPEFRFYLSKEQYLTLS